MEERIFLDTTIRSDMVIDIFHTSKRWYVLSISLGCCRNLR